MLLAIDVGNTHSVFGLRDGAAWKAVWRRATSPQTTEDELATWLKSLFELVGADFRVDGLICCSVAPHVDYAIRELGAKWFRQEVVFLEDGAAAGLTVDYDPPHGVGPDRLANALAALEIAKPPIVVVDFGTATTFDVINARSEYVGGAILAGPLLSAAALQSRTALLPKVELHAPNHAIGHNTVEALQSGLVLGYGGAVDSMIERIEAELGEPVTVLATGGMALPYLNVTKRLGQYEPTLTLQGLVIAFERLSGRTPGR